MTKGSDSREFFEIFKKPQSEENIQNKEVKPLIEPMEVSLQPKPPITENNPVAKPTVTADPLDWI
ncbi:MAG: hypothetical protein KGJ07_10170, partial [Patescibacteria group bacterium]|nr:hypothetical protein [Patescibacteria group bacterium]